LNDTATAGRRQIADAPQLLIDRPEVARLMCCSVRHVERLAQRNAMPQPVKLGALTRWPRSTIESWIERGCPVESVAGGVQ
jgi:predicted DNA-binding transcriptional regulator AlpA